MKNSLFVLFFGLAFAYVAGAQTRHQFLDDRSILNYNHNWGAIHMDTLHCKAAIDTVLLTGAQSGYNILVQPMAGDVKIKLDGTWSNWWTVYEGAPFSISGGELDSLFISTAETDSSVVQIMWTAFK